MRQLVQNLINKLENNSIKELTYDHTRILQNNKNFQLAFYKAFKNNDSVKSIDISLDKFDAEALPKDELLDSITLV